MFSGFVTLGIFDWIGGFVTGNPDASAILPEPWGNIVQLVLGILGVASIIAKMTPTQADNAIIDKILSLVHTLGLTKKAPPSA
jgi:hypothetical protein